MPEIEHRRHSIRSDSSGHLTQEGVDLARRVGESMGHFDLVVTSKRTRAVETAVSMGYAVNRHDDNLADLPNAAEFEVGGDLSCLGASRAFPRGGEVTKTCLKQAAILRGIASELTPDGRALVVSHGGIIELGVVGLLPHLDYSTWGDAFERCEGVRLRFDGDVCVSAEPLRL
jgi:broad specificity phosphatase PhoE